jgi:ribosomal protein L11 methyltransferase
MRHWLVVELLVPKEFEEAVSNFLIEQGAPGIEELDGNSKWERLRTYFLQNGKEKRVLHALHRYIISLRKITPETPHITIKTASLTEQDWGENWKRSFKPVIVTPKLIVKPTWLKAPLKRGQIPINIDPGMAFGTGTHMTTILSIQALEERLKRKKISSVLDVGTGSGILSIIAAKLSAKEVLGVDIDGVAVGIARENVKKNCVSDIVKIRKGSVGHLQKKFDMIVANIDLKSLRRMRWPLLRHLKNQGFLILSGILEEEKDGICQCYLKTGILRLIKMVQREGWICITFKKKWSPTGKARGT